MELFGYVRKMQNIFLKFLLLLLLFGYNIFNFSFFNFSSNVCLANEFYSILKRENKIKSE